MRLVAWLLGRWRADEDDITFTFRGCARDMGLTWGGSRDAAFRDQLTRIHRTRMAARVFNALTVCSQRTHSLAQSRAHSVAAVRTHRLTSE